VASLLPVGARVLTAGDFRVSTPVLKTELADGLLSAGAHVLDAGQIPTPVAYFAHRHWRADAVLVVTASHNPAQYNGFMIGKLPSAQADFYRLRRYLERGTYRKASGSIEVIDPIPLYIAWIRQRWGKLANAGPMAVVLDPGNGAWSELAPRLFEELGFRVHRLHCEIDGTFPQRSPDCARSSDLSALRSKVPHTGARMGIAWDGDGDRVAFVDETGTVVSTDYVSVLFIRYLLSSEPGAKVVYDVKLSETVRQAVVANGGIPVVERSGHAFIKRRMIQENCLLGCEASGHYFFRELQGGDDGLFAALLMAELVSREGSLASLRRALPPVYATPDLRFPTHVLPYTEVVMRLQASLKAAQASSVDGLRLETSDGFVLARESVTEPAITLRVEGFSKQGLKRLIGLCVRTLPELAHEMKEQIEQAG